MPNKKVVALFVEGPTEIEFYKAVVKYVREAMGTPFNCTFEWIDMQGIGNYKNDAIRKFRALQSRHPNEDIYVVLCIDTDVFEFAKKPPINKMAIKKTIQNAGAKRVHYIEAKHSIEDWFLLDSEGVISYLGLPANTKFPKGNGQEVLKELFKKARKVYVKGRNTGTFINSLDVGKIMKTCCSALKVLCDIVGVDCKKVCNKQ